MKSIGITQGNILIMNDEQFEKISGLLENQINHSSAMIQELGAIAYFVGFFIAFGMNWASRDWDNFLEIIPVVLWSLLSWVNVGSFLVN